MNLSVMNSKTKVDVPDAVFGADFNESLVHQLVTAYLAGARAGTKAGKSRSGVSGGGAKPWRQKGTGRARAGTIRSPIWRSGGQTFAAEPRNYSQKINRKMYRAGMRAILSELVRQERLVVVEKIEIDEPKTKQMVELLAKLGVDRALLVSENVDRNVYLASRNIPHINICDAAALDPVSLVGSEKVVMTVDALKAIEGRLQ